MRIHFWNTVLSLFFAVLVLWGSFWLLTHDLVYYRIRVLDIILIALAVFRLTRLMTYDVITKFIRDWFVNAKQDSFGHTIGALLNCPWCTGLWFSFFVVFFFFATPLAWPIILVLAMAALGSFFQVLANLIGWSAEEKKRRVEAMPK